MYIAYLWVDSWLKLMTACAEQMQQVSGAGSDGDARAVPVGDVERLRVTHVSELALERAAFAEEMQRLQSEHADERQELQVAHAAAIEAMQKAHAAEVETLRASLADNEAARAETERQRTEIQAELARRERQAGADRAEQPRAQRGSLRRRSGARVSGAGLWPFTSRAEFSPMASDQRRSCAGGRRQFLAKLSLRLRSGERPVRVATRRSRSGQKQP
ncbi:MAG TPA: hypothetical protein VES39_05960 [Rhodospirillales bacterium]|nr:hypothetical protein [Rhodospirillales bacterium]